jgi:hypothetical protein
VTEAGDTPAKRISDSESVAVISKVGGRIYMQNTSMQNMHLCIFLHISCIFYCISGAYFLHIFCIFSAYVCIFSEFMCIFLAYD